MLNNKFIIWLLRIGICVENNKNISSPIRDCVIIVGA